ncbi:unnamed protein product [Cuscuta campestris]|uniref:Uncharacterized protein n=1 Tax=Cuscuta campestris TaxID=132261 RepID=A0A484MUX6_9ASTE|nr:unnamed protein product [Cuscuta campestris]
MKKWYTFSAVREIAEIWAKDAGGKGQNFRRKLWGTLSKAGLIAGTAESMAQIGGAVASSTKHGFRKTVESIRSRYDAHPSTAEMLKRIDENVLELLKYHKIMERSSQEDGRQGGGGGGSLPIKGGGSRGGAEEEKKNGEKGTGGGPDEKKKKNGDNGKNGGGGGNGGGGAKEPSNGHNGAENGGSDVPPPFPFDMDLY